MSHNDDDDDEEEEEEEEEDVDEDDAQLGDPWSLALVVEPCWIVHLSEVWLYLASGCYSVAVLAEAWRG